MWWWGTASVVPSGPTLVFSDVFDGVADTLLTSHTPSPTNTLSLSWAAGKDGAGNGLKLNGSGILVNSSGEWNQNSLSDQISGAHFACLNYGSGGLGRLQLHVNSDYTQAIQLIREGAEAVRVDDYTSNIISTKTIGSSDVIGIGTDAASTPTVYLYKSSDDGSTWTLLGSASAGGARSSTYLQLNAEASNCDISQLRVWNNWSPW